MFATLKVLGNVLEQVAKEIPDEVVYFSSYFSNSFFFLSKVGL